MASARRVVAVGLIVATCNLLGAVSAKAGAAAPLPVLTVAVSSPSANTTLTASWTTSKVGAPATFFVAQAFTTAGRFFGQAWCFQANCTSVSIPGVAPNKLYTVTVYPGNSAGYGAPRTSAPYVVVPGCLDGNELCAAVTTGSTNGAAVFRGQGFQDGAPLAATEMAALHPRIWRMGISTSNYPLFDSARASGAKVIAIVSDAWFGYTYNPVTGAPTAPWTDWNAYRSWVRSYATALVSSGHRPDYWDVQNEPGVPGYLNATDTAAWTPALILEQFNVAYTEIRAVDPTAKVIGPSVVPFTVVARPKVLDLRTFLDYAEAHGIQLGAIAWHENSPWDRDGDTSALPVSIAYHVDAIRRLLATHNVGQPEILIDEYGAHEVRWNPGWAVGYLTNLERANVDGANRTCWPAEGWPTYNECTSASADGLFTSDGAQRLTNYWVYRFYADMAGTRVTARTSSDALSTYAVTGANGVVRVLLGRHEQCTPTVTLGCSAYAPVASPAKNVSIDVDASPLTLQWHVTVNRIPVTMGPVPAPELLLDTTVTSVSGRIHIPLTGIRDGEAITVTLTPGA